MHSVAAIIPDKQFSTKKAQIMLTIWLSRSMKCKITTIIEDDIMLHSIYSYHTNFKIFKQALFSMFEAIVSWKLINAESNSNG